MNSIMVLGAGTQGGPCASALIKATNIPKIILGEYDVELAQRVKEKINSNRIHIKKVDASKIESIVEAAQGVDVVINLINPLFNLNVMTAALECGAHYVDTSIGETLDLDLMGSDNILARMIKGLPLHLDKEFKEKDLTCLMGCGATPGLTNVFARYLCDKFTSIDEIKIRFGRKSTKKNEEIISAWEPVWSPERALWGYAVKPVVFTGGEYQHFPIYSGYEEFNFPEPVGTIPLVYHQHPEQVTLPYFIGKGIKYCDFKYTIDSNVGTLIKMGFAEDTTIQIDGMDISPKKVLLTMVKRPVINAFLEESEKSVDLPLTAIPCASVEVVGKKNGQSLVRQITYVPSLYENPSEKREIFNKYGATNIYVSLPAIIGAMISTDKKAPFGIISAECIDPELFLNRMADIGQSVKFVEKSIKTIEW